MNSGNNWTIHRDFEPGAARYSSNSSDLTLTDQTYAPLNNKPLNDCGPHWEFYGDNNEESVSEVDSYL